MRTLVEQYLESKRIRSELQKVVDQLKDREEEIKRAIMLNMQASGLKSANVDGLATCTAKDKYFYEITDYDRFADIMAKMINQCMVEGKPRLEGTLLQKTVCASRIDELIDRFKPQDEAAFLEQIGLQRKSRTELSITKK